LSLVNIFDENFKMKYKPRSDSKPIKLMRNLKIDKGIASKEEEEKAFTISETHVDVKVNHSIAEINFS